MHEEQGQRGFAVTRERTSCSSPPSVSDRAVCLLVLNAKVLHTEPHYSRKDDVPPRPREFAGNVFRIPHKDSLQVNLPAPRCNFLRLCTRGGGKR